jgi:Zn-dependent protease
MGGASLADLTLQQIGLRFFAFVLIVGVHGAVVAATACALGDQGPRYDGRLKLSPLAHIDLLGFASGVLFAVGWIKPVAIDPKALRIGRIGLLVIVATSLIAVLGFAMAWQLLRPLLLPFLNDTPSTLTFGLIEAIGQLGIWFALINLLPVPPLTGSLLLTALIPAAGEFTRRYHIYFALVLAALAATGLVTRALEPLYRVIAEIILRS